MSEPKKLSEQELAHIQDCREEGYPDPDDDMSRVLAIRDVARLLQHIDVLKAEQAATMQQVVKDAYTNGAAVGAFIKEQTDRIEAMNTVFEEIVARAPVDLPAGNPESPNAAFQTGMLFAYWQMAQMVKKILNDKAEKANTPG